MSDDQREEERQRFRKEAGGARHILAEEPQPAPEFRADAAKAVMAKLKDRYKQLEQLLEVGGQAASTLAAYELATETDAPQGIQRELWQHHNDRRAALDMLIHQLDAVGANMRPALEAYAKAAEIVATENGGGTTS